LYLKAKFRLQTAKFRHNQLAFKMKTRIMRAEEQIMSTVFKLLTSILTIHVGGRNGGEK